MPCRYHPKSGIALLIPKKQSLDKRMLLWIKIERVSSLSVNSLIRQYNYCKYIFVIAKYQNKWGKKEG